jgi:hypothetical protein
MLVFNSMNDKLNAILAILDKKYRHHDKILTEHERRLKDLDTAHRAVASSD